MNPMVKVIVLCLVIAVCLFSIWNQLFGGKSIPEVVVSAYQCSVCQHTFERSNVELREMQVDEATLQAHKFRTADQPHCPGCNAKHTGLLMARCPSCKHDYPPTTVNLRADPNAIVPPPVCPKCGTDLNKWIEEHGS